VTEGADADGLYRAAIERLGRTVVRPELARAHLLYGEWLRRGNRRSDARAQLASRTSCSRRSGWRRSPNVPRRELVATGGRVRKRTVETTDELTAQEWQVALLARDGMSNSDIGARLFLSQHTVAYHLRKVFSKLGISSRRELAAALPSSESELAPA
jgi:ATP/maltotriose-dependent transcriptional regulator MalT